MQVCRVYCTFIVKLSLEDLNINNSSHCRFNQEIMNCGLTYILSKCGLIVQIGNLIRSWNNAAVAAYVIYLNGTKCDTQPWNPGLYL